MGGVGSETFCGHHVYGEEHLASLGAFEEFPHRRRHLLLDEAGPHRVPFRHESRVGHSAPNGQHVAGFHHRGKNAQFVRDLGPAEDHYVRPGRVVKQLAQGSQLAGQQRPGHRLHPGRHPRRRGVGAVDRPEGVLAEQIGRLRQSGPQCRVIGDLPGMEAGVLQKDHVSGRRPFGRFCHLWPYHGRHMMNPKASQLLHATGHRRQAEVRIGSVGAAQVAAHQHRRAPRPEFFYSPRRGANPKVVGHLPAVQRHVQVGAQQYPSPLDLDIIEGQKGGHPSAHSHTTSFSHSRPSWRRRIAKVRPLKSSSATKRINGPVRPDGPVTGGADLLPYDA